MDLPQLGFGTWNLRGEECKDSVLKALEVGFRHLDTADGYGNHREVAQAIKQSGVPRHQLFITTKIPRVLLAPDDVLKSCDRYLAELGTDYLDLLLIHWPNSTVPIEQTLEAFERLKQAEKIKSVGVSNFTIHHLEDVKRAGFKVVNNQIELHPSFNQKRLVEYCQQKNIMVTAYSPLGRGESLSLPQVTEIAQSHQATPSQVILAWIRQQGIIAIPKSTNPKHIEDNFRSLDLELSAGEMRVMDNIPQADRLVKPPTSEFDY